MKPALDSPTDPTRATIIAIVDDDPRTLASLESLLESADHQVRSFASGPALVASGVLAQIDCLISDVAMPGMDGYELMRVARKARPGLPVILVSGRPDVASRATLAGLAEYQFFRKPFDGEALLAAVGLALHRASPHSPGPE
jgi:FixJ family two-component response regulator